MNDGTVLELTRDQIVERLERGLHRRLGRSAREVLLAYRAGKLDDPGRVADLLILADLLPKYDPLFAAV